MDKAKFRKKTNDPVPTKNLDGRIDRPYFKGLLNQLIVEPEPVSTAKPKTIKKDYRT